MKLPYMVSGGGGGSSVEVKKNLPTPGHKFYFRDPLASFPISAEIRIRSSSIFGCIKEGSGHPLPLRLFSAVVPCLEHKTFRNET